MLKNLLRSIYIRFLNYNFRFFNFILPNIFYTGRIKRDNTPICEQITLIRGKGTVEIGRDCHFGYRPGGFNRNGSVEFQARYSKAVIKIGNEVSTNNNIFICAANRIEIGSQTLIGQNVTIMDFEAHGIHPDKRREIGEIGKIIIGQNVWIGNNVLILRDTSIGNNSIVAAGAVVKGYFPDNVIIGGVPAKIIKNVV